MKDEGRRMKFFSMLLNNLHANNQPVLIKHGQ
jgi:hypothetical protein